MAPRGVVCALVTTGGRGHVISWKFGMVRWWWPGARSCPGIGGGALERICRLVELDGFWRWQERDWHSVAQCTRRRSRSVVLVSALDSDTFSRIGRRSIRAVNASLVGALVNSGGVGGGR